MFISIPHPNQVYDKQKKTFLSGDLCNVYCHALKYFFPGWRLPVLYGL